MFQGCCKEVKKSNSEVYEVASQVQPYVNMFVQAARINGRELQINRLIVELTDEGIASDTLGICIEDKVPLIRINSRYWYKLSPWHRRLLVFHELGHCILKLNHNDSHGSIMSTYSIGDEGYNDGSYQVLDRTLFELGY
jgi:hypothetical protein